MHWDLKAARYSVLLEGSINLGCQCAACLNTSVTSHGCKLPLLGIDEACKSAEASLADDVGVHGWLELALYILSSIYFPMTNDFP